MELHRGSLLAEQLGPPFYERLEIGSCWTLHSESCKDVLTSNRGSGEPVPVGSIQEAILLHTGCESFRAFQTNRSTTIQRRTQSKRRRST